MAEKKLPETSEVKRAMIERHHPTISIRRQCELIGLPRSSLYYESAGESPYNLLLMRLIDQQYTKTPFYGWPRMTNYLHRQGRQVNHKRVQRLTLALARSAVSIGSAATWWPGNFPNSHLMGQW